MDTANGQRISGDFITLHEGIPLWFPRLVSYILNSLQGKDRFNIYNASRSLNSMGQPPFIFATDIREVLEPFDGYGLSFSGNHKQKILLKKSLIHFWASFFLHVQTPSDYELGFFALMLQRRRFNDIVEDSYLRAHLPGGCRSLNKNCLIAILLKEVFSTPENHSEYEQNRLNHLSDTARKIYLNLSSVPIGLSVFAQEYGPNTPQAVYDLCEALLARPIYTDIEGKLHLHISRFRGFQIPYQFPVTSPLTYASIFECLNVALSHARMAIESGINESQDELYAYQFPKRQILLFEKNSPVARIVLEFMAWWRETLGSHPVKKEWLPQNNYTLTQDYSGGYRVLALEEYNPDLYVKEAVDYGLLQEDSSGYLILTELGTSAGIGFSLDMNVKAIWGRNVDKVSLTLGACWPIEYRMLLKNIGSYHDNGRCEITKKEVIDRKIPEAALLLILGGFIKLDNKRLLRLRRWYLSDPILKILQAVAIPVGENIDSEKLSQIGKAGKYVCKEVAGFIIIIGISRSQLIKFLER